jgi:predicted secreted protein with PEFG-CTERM motif
LTSTILGSHQGKYWLLALVVIGLCTFSAAHAEVLVTIPKGAAMPACADTKSCYSPDEVTVSVGTTVTWTNSDSAGHFVTSGKDATADGKFDSGMIMAGSKFSQKFDAAGKYDYFCMVHPWMTGTVIVSDTSDAVSAITISTELPLYEPGDTVNFSGFISNLSDDRSTLVTIRVVGPLIDGSTNIVTAKQVLPNSDGTYSDSFFVGGPLWTKKGDYKIIVNYGPQKAETTFFYNGGEEQSDQKILIIPKVSTEPKNPRSDGTTKLKIDFVNTQANTIQEHIDYTVSITKDGDAVFGPIPLAHTSTGTVVIPIQFTQSGSYLVTVEVQGVLFRPIPTLITTFTLNVDQSSDSIPDETRQPQNFDDYTDPITVSTDEDYYNDGDIITVYGKVGERLVGYDVTFQLFAPTGDLVVAQQLPVAADNTFNIELGTGGPLWRFGGTYTVKVLYGTASRTAQTTFEFNNSDDHTSNITINIPAGASAPGCEETHECYIDSEVTIDVGSEVVWSNDDSASHTVTSGDPKNGPDGNFDSSLFLAGQTFSHKFEEAGEFPYFCQVHPWMQGTVIVQEAHGDEHTDEEGDHGEHGAMVMSQDGSVMVHIDSDVPAEGKEAVVSVEFVDADGNPVEHVNFEITATQDGNEVLSETGQHAHSGVTEFTTAALGSDSPLDVQVTILGLGLPDSDPATWAGPKGETVSAQVVPEFGPLAMIILATAIVSIVAVSARSKVIPRL